MPGPRIAYFYIRWRQRVRIGVKDLHITDAAGFGFWFHFCQKTFFGDLSFMFNSTTFKDTTAHANRLHSRRCHLIVFVAFGLQSQRIVHIFNNFVVRKSLDQCLQQMFASLLGTCALVAMLSQPPGVIVDAFKCIHDKSGRMIHCKAHILFQPQSIWVALKLSAVCNLSLPLQKAFMMLPQKLQWCPPNVTLRRECSSILLWRQSMPNSQWPCAASKQFHCQFKQLVCCQGIIILFKLRNLITAKNHGKLTEMFVSTPCRPILQHHWDGTVDGIRCGLDLSDMPRVPAPHRPCSHLQHLHMSVKLRSDDFPSQLKCSCTLLERLPILGLTVFFSFWLKLQHLPVLFLIFLFSFIQHQALWLEMVCEHHLERVPITNLFFCTLVPTEPAGHFHHGAFLPERIRRLKGCIPQSLCRIFSLPLNSQICRNVRCKFQEDRAGWSPRLNAIMTNPQIATAIQSSISLWLLLLLSLLWSLLLLYSFIYDNEIKNTKLWTET